MNDLDDQKPRTEAIPPTHEVRAPAPEADVKALADVEQLGLWAALASLSYVFWIVGGMEMVERLAYYGVKAVAALYAKDPVSAGGLGITMTSFGTILMGWALIQSIVPAFTGGLSDRFGYKETIFASTVVKIAGYLVMAAFPTYGGFAAGAVLLATGTAIFKPGIQGTLVKATNRQNSSMAWGVFYQTVNVGGFLGPLVAGYMRKMEWRYVFLACAAIICLNFLLLLTYREPDKEARLERARLEKEGKLTRRSLVAESMVELRKPHVWSYLLIFSGFWFMFNALFDVLPVHIDDWVDSRDIVRTLFGAGANAENVDPVLGFFVILNEDGTAIQPEGLLNLNAGLIMTTCFLFAYLSGRLRATDSMVLGTLMACVALFVAGFALAGWVMVFGILCFSVGEMLSSPKFSEFIGNFAPDDKKAMYLGFSQIPLAVGWTLEGWLGPTLYDHLASKDRFARAALAERGMDWETVSAIPQGEAFSRLVDFTGEDPWALTAALHAEHSTSIASVWIVMAAVGLVSAAGIWIYGRYTRRLASAGG